jgi:DNA-binding CsgD family transcriptional regulator
MGNASTEGHECRADGAMGLLKLGRRWPVAVRLAEEALADETCRRSPLCVWRALATLVYAGELVVADRLSLGIARETSCRAVLNRAISVRATIAHLRGDLPHAIDLYDSLRHRETESAVRLHAVCGMAEVLVDLDQPECAQQLLAAHHFDEEILPDGFSRATLLAARGAVALATGEFHRALGEYLACGRFLNDQRIVNPALLPWRHKAALAANAVGRVRLARGLARHEHAAAMRWGEPRAIGCVLAVLALVDSECRAVDLLEEATELLDVAGARLELAKVRYELGLRLGDHGKRGKGRGQLEQARDAFVRIGTTHRAEQAELALRRFGVPACGPALTRQEAKIAKLAQAGLTNKQIAGRQFLALRTVEVHLSQVYRKLGLSGRDELRTAAL